MLTATIGAFAIACSLLSGRRDDIVGSLLQVPARHRHLSRPLPGAPAPQPPAWERAPLSVDGAIAPGSGARHRRRARNLAETFLRGLGRSRPRASVRNVTGSPLLRRSASPGWLAKKSVSRSPRPRGARAAHPVALSVARRGRAAAGGWQLLPVAVLARLAHRGVMTHDLLYVCSPTPLPHADLDGLGAASSRCGDLGSAIAEHEPSCATASWTLLSKPTSRAASTMCAQTSPVRACLTSDCQLACAGAHRARLRPRRIISSMRDRSGHHALLSHRDEELIARRISRAAQRGLSRAGGAVPAAPISNILLSQNVTQYTKMTRDCLHELASLLFSISGRLCIGYAG